MAPLARINHSVTSPVTANTEQNRSNAEGFFRYHGWLSPGVRLLRNLKFPAKAASVSVLFIIPLVAMLWFLWSSASVLVDSTRHERQGVNYAAPVAAFLSALQDQRWAAIGDPQALPEAQSKLAAAFAKVETKQQAMGASLNTENGFNDMKTAYQKLVHQPVLATPFETFQAYSNLAKSAISLINDLADGSELSLDPEIDTFHLMNFSLLIGPQYEEQLTQLRDLGTLAMRDGEASGERRIAMQAALSLQAFIDSGVERSFQHAVLVSPEAAKQFDMPGVDQSRDAMLAVLEKEAMAFPPHGDANRFWALAASAIDKQRYLDSQALVVLDMGLAERIESIHFLSYTRFAASRSIKVLMG